MTTCPYCHKDIDDPDIMATHFAAEVENGKRKPLKIVKTVRLGNKKPESGSRMRGVKLVNMYVFERTE